MNNKEIKDKSQEKFKIMESFNKAFPSDLTTGGVAISTLALLTQKPNSDLMLLIGICLTVAGAGGILSDCITKQKKQRMR